MVPDLNTKNKNSATSQDMAQRLGETRGDYLRQFVASNFESGNGFLTRNNLKGDSLRLSSVDLSYDRGSPLDANASLTSFSQASNESTTTTFKTRVVNPNSFPSSGKHQSTGSISSEEISSFYDNYTRRNEVIIRKESNKVTERRDSKVDIKGSKRSLNILDGNARKLEDKVKMLEGELREAAAIEAALYSVVAEHGSSMSKVHAPARRLSRLYFHSCKEKSQSRKASAARSAVSGIVLVAKACGNDVSRLTFWLSNSVVFRAIVSQEVVEPKKTLSTRSTMKVNGNLKGNNKSPSVKNNGNSIHNDLSNWEDPFTFVTALKRIEAWIFSRIVESIWWQTFTPNMQLTATKPTESSNSTISALKKSLKRKSKTGLQDQVHLSLDLWRRAFTDACERLCPLRAEGHECGCLPLLTRMIMEQCVARLDVAMFNAILRESADDRPTDPVSDPITDVKVLPIPVGKSSFGAGVQLKNTIGNWSRWLTSLFGIDDEIQNNKYKDQEKRNASIKSFDLLNALSDLMMLPKDMLLDKSARKEVCPRFSTPLIKRILSKFVTDEFCRDPIPEDVFKALDSMETITGEEELISTIPCNSAAPKYSPPSVASIIDLIGEVETQSRLDQGGSLVLRKSYTSDDELDELNSPLASISTDSHQTSTASAKACKDSKQKGNKYAIRYELLKGIWKNSM